MDEHTFVVTTPPKESRVEVVNDANHPVPVSISGGSGGDGAILDGANSSIKATVKDLTNSNPLATVIVDGNGDQITSFGGGVQYDEGDNIATTPTGTLTMVRDGSNLAEPLVQPLTDTQLRATAVPISASSLPLPTGASTSANQTTIIGYVDGIETLLGTIDADTSTLAGAVSGTEMQVDVVASLPAGTNNIGDVDVASIAAGTNYIGKVRPTDGTTDAEVVPLAGYNAQAVAIVDGSGNQITSFGGGTQYADGAARGSATGTLMMGDDGTNIQSVKVDSNGELQIDVLSSALPTGAATSANQATEQTLLGAVNETAPASDTASSGLNGRLQRIAQRITSLIALIPTALTSLGNFKVSIQEATGATPASASYTSAQTNTTFLTPTSGKKIVVTGRHCTVDIDTSVAVTVRMAFGSPVSTTACLLKHEGLAPGSIYAPPMLAPVKGAVNQSLFVTTTAATDGSVDFVVDYYEE